MVTGQLPFPSDNPYARLDAPAPSARSIARDVPERWERAIARCLERDPKDRFASAAEVAAAIATGSLPLAKRTRRRIWQAIGGVALVAAVAVGTAYVTRRHARAPAVTPAATATTAAHPPARRRRTVVVLGFRNLSGRADDAWLSTALGEMLVTEIAAGADLRVVPPDTVARMKLEMGLHDGDTVAVPTLQHIRDRARSGRGRRRLVPRPQGARRRARAARICACRRPTRARPSPPPARPRATRNCSSSCRTPATRCARSSARPSRQRRRRRWRARRCRRTPRRRASTPRA